MKIRSIIFILFILLFNCLSCNDNSLNIDKVEHQYIMTDQNSLNISLIYSTNNEVNNAQYITLTSPDNNLRWESNSYNVVNNKKYLQSSLFAIPYSLEGEWKVNIKQGENNVEKTFSSSTPDISQIKYPIEFNNLKLIRVNGNSYTFFTDKLDENINDVFWDVYSVFKEDNSFHFLRRQRRLRNFTINISNRISYVVFVLENKDGVKFYKVILI